MPRKQRNWKQTSDYQKDTGLNSFLVLCTLMPASVTSQEPVAGEVTGPGAEHTTVVFVNGHVAKLHSNYF